MVSISEFSEHGLLFEQLVGFNECKTIVEIGVAYGTTTAGLCRGANRHGGHVYAFDIWRQHGLQNQFQPMSSLVEVDKSLRDNNLTNFTLHQVDSKTLEFDKILDNIPKIDFAFIDGCHSYQGIENDFNKIYPRLNLPGIIAFHDTLRIDGCREFVLDLRKNNRGEYDIVDFPFGNKNRRVGITLLVKRNYPYLGIDIDEDCGSKSTRSEIIQQEKLWYDQSLKTL